jgi:hypothetical protein
MNNKNWLVIGVVVLVALGVYYNFGVGLGPLSKDTLDSESPKGLSASDCVKNWEAAHNECSDFESIEDCHDACEAACNKEKGPCDPPCEGEAPWDSDCCFGILLCAGQCAEECDVGNMGEIPGEACRIRADEEYVKCMQNVVR